MKSIEFIFVCKNIVRCVLGFMGLIVGKLDGI